MNSKTNFELKREIIQNIFLKYKDKDIKAGKLSGILKISVKQSQRLWNEFKREGKAVAHEHKRKNTTSKRKIDCT